MHFAIICRCASSSSAAPTSFFLFMASGVLTTLLRSHPRTLRTASSPACLARAMFSPATSSTSDQKVIARRQLIDALRHLSPEQMAAESSAITENLHATGIVHAAKRMAIYVHCAKLREVDTTAALLEALQGNAARVYAPRVQDKDANMHFIHITTLDELVQVPPFGIREPPPNYPDGRPREDAAETDAPLDVVIMPGLGFAPNGRRLGRGGGYYDKFVAQCLARAAERGWHPPLLVALAYRAQVVADVPCDPHDQPVDLLVTADGVRYLSERGEAYMGAASKQRNLANARQPI